MKVLCATLAAVLLAAGAAAAQPETPLGSEVASGEDQGFITREWIWSTGTATTTFTAYGSAEQVNQLDPRNGPLACQECELASSVQFEPGDELQPISSH